jgi:hypothetical protein
MRKNLITLVIVATVCSQIAWAQAEQQASHDAVMKFFAAAHLEEQVQQVQSVMVNEMSKSIRGTLENNSNLSAADKDQIMQLVEPEMKNASTIYPVHEMLEDMAPVYQKHFTDTDMQAITTFFESEVGKKFIHESGPMMQEAMAVIMPKMNARVQAQMADMQKRIMERLKEQEEKKKQ